ncbi:MAG: NYN domain-containing protein [Candidatus Sungbacteria bacterium]|nr:NYN domain-containing protein [Candidatus Sungbacteria bacterium]
MPSAGICIALNETRAVDALVSPGKTHQVTITLNQVLSTIIQYIHKEGLHITTSWLHVFSSQVCHPLIRRAIEKQGFKLHENVDLASGQSIASLYDKHGRHLPETLVVAYPTWQLMAQVATSKPHGQEIWVGHERHVGWNIAARQLILPRIPNHKIERRSAAQKAAVLLDIENVIEAHDDITQKRLDDLFLLIQATAEWLEKRGLRIDKNHSVACLRHRHPETERVRKIVEFFGIKLKSPPANEPAENKLDYHSMLLVRQREGPGTILLMSGDGHLFRTMADLQRDQRYVVLVSWLAQAHKSLRSKADEFVSLQEILEETGHHCLPTSSR